MIGKKKHRGPKPPVITTIPGISLEALVIINKLRAGQISQVQPPSAVEWPLPEHSEAGAHEA